MSHKNNKFAACPFCGGELEEVIEEYTINDSSYNIHLSDLSGRLDFIDVGATCTECGVGFMTLTSGAHNRESLLKRNIEMLNRRPSDGVQIH